MQKKKKPLPVVAKAAPPPPSIFPWNFKIKCYILLAIGFVFYANSVFNEYALDDSIAIQRNEFVQKGVSGIGKLLTSDAYASFYSQMGVAADAQYSGGRYRPLSYVTFAIEQSLFGDSPFIRHLVNVLMFMLCLFAIFYFLDKYLLKKIPSGGDVAFLSVVLFAIHPIHTEVVANIKSLDEIMSLTLIMGTFIFALRYNETKKMKDLGLGLLCYLLALLAKEYGITLLVMLPLLFYIVTKNNPIDSLLKSLPYYGVFLIYFLMRKHAVGTPHSTPANDPMVDPFLFASSAQKHATEFWALGKYLLFLFIPYPLSCDYSYATIPYHNFSDISSLLPILIYGVIIAWAFKEFLQRNILSFMMIFFLICILLISNLFIELGAVLGERLLFHASIGFLVVLSYYALKAAKKVPFQTRKNIVMGALGAITIAAGAITIPRNAQWKNNDTLYIHDVNVSTHSALLNNDAGWCYLGLSETKDPNVSNETRRTYWDSAKKYLYRALAIHPKYATCCDNLASVYFHYEIPDSAKVYIDKVKQLYGNHISTSRISGLVAKQFMDRATYFGGQQKPLDAIAEMRKASQLTPEDPDIWYNLGGGYMTVQRYDSAKAAWTNVLRLNPNYQYKDVKTGQMVSLANLVNTIFVTKP